MKVVHRPDTGGPAATIASDVDVASTRWQRARGLMFTRGLPEGGALVFPFDATGRRSVHMVGVVAALDVIWTVDDRVTHVKRLRPMIGLGVGRADRIIECPAGAAADVEVGDRVAVVDD